MIYAVIDTNVLVAAAKTHKPDSSTSKIVSLVLSGTIQPLVCEEILDEYEQILNLPVLEIPREKASVILEKFRRDGINPGMTESGEDFPDPDDRIFYEISLSVDDAYLVTKNKKHFPRKPMVVTPSEMLVYLAMLGII